MQIKNIEFILENCDSINISGEYIGDIVISDITEHIKRTACNSVDWYKQCEFFKIEINQKANILDCPFGMTDPGEDLMYLKFDRLCENDITEIILTCEDIVYNKHTKKNIKDKRIYKYMVDYAEPKGMDMVLGAPNINQSCYVSDLGHLYILLNPKSNIMKEIDRSTVNNSSYMDNYWKMLS